MITNLAFVVYPVTDIARSRQFYEETLGLKLTHEFGGGWCEYDLGDTAFVICSADAEHPTPVRGALAAFEVADLEAAAARVKAAGASPHGGMVDAPVCRFLKVRDPDGNEMLLHQRTAKA